MKTAIRRQMTINPEVMDALNGQIALEMHASASYLAMASWCDQRELLNSKAFFYKQAEEERAHGMKIFNFINETGGAAISPAIPEVNNDFESLREIYEKSLDQEIAVTQSIYKCFKAARNVDDFASEVFLQWFVNEQIEEEDTVRSIIDIFDLMEGMPLKMIDERLPTE
ncbi:ferritin [Polaribacter reichenbachii]|uniref:Ferritin n=1 Tax=Polaribacter reichenbachii TaxID=996801 RepID=A0A1B8U621_9FLAO|nr:ferritin [Polaribacter reichenbachii]APZ45950.1 ferritin [Polaribacter reichenbachii]AUC19812.1 ferritin [Polaribacter reichenbachii]OBY67333.1 ferritin [Polaribacter reichenbachii]